LSIHMPGDEYMEKFGVAVAWAFSLRSWPEAFRAWIRNEP